MKYKIIEHYSKETGHFMGYTIAYKPLPLIPYWREIPVDRWYSEISKAEHDICFMMKCNNDLKVGKEFH